MASIGRGRGWAKTADQGTVLRRPGQSTSPKTCEIDDIINKIYDLDFEEPPVDGILEIYTAIQSFQDLEQALDKFWNLALEDRCFGMKYTKTVVSKIDHPISELQMNIWKSLMRKLQDISEKQYELNKENHARFTNFVWMLAMTGDKVPVTKVRMIMSSVLVTSLSISLENMTEDDMETVAVQLYLYGMRLKEALDIKAAKCSSDAAPDEVTLADIVNEARQILVNRNVSARSRALLLFIIDLANQQYQPFSGDLQTFYATVLEPTYVQENGSSVFKGREFNQELYLYRLLTKETVSSENETDTETAAEQVRNKAMQQQVNKVQRNDGTSAPVPRAIRGVGASENAKDHKNKKKSPRGHKDKLTDQEVWSAKQNTNVKVWGHDDRFHNDYE